MLELVLTCLWMGLRTAGVQRLVLACYWVEPGPSFSGCRALGVPVLLSAHLASGARCPETSVCRLVDGARSCGGWHQGPNCPKASIGLLVGGLFPDMAHCRTVVLLGLVPTGWWEGLCPSGSQGWCPCTGG